MKLTLLLLIPCIACARVGERYEEFSKRVKVPPSKENSHPNGLIEATYRVGEILVMLQILDGRISTETYAPVDEAQASALVAKTAQGVAPKKIGDQTIWVVPGRFRAVFYENILEITDGRASNLMAEIKEKEAKARAQRSVNKLAPF
jgi:hypothetical protein